MTFTEQQFRDYELRRLQKYGQPIKSDAVELEAGLHDAIESECKRRAWPFVHSRMDKATGQARGVPDFVIATNLWNGLNRKVLWVECKSRTGKQSPDQMGFQMMLEKNGHDYHLIRSFTEFLKLINENHT